MVVIAEEKAVDYALTAILATEAFADEGVKFSPERIRWLYERSFGQGTTVLAALEDGQKIGQIELSETPSNLAFGDGDMQSLFITARSTLYRVRLGVKGPSN